MATSVEFHTGVPDTVAFACRLLRKAHRLRMTVLCLASPARLEALDKGLWTFAERDFLPHVRFAGAAQNVLRRTPIWLASAWPAAGREHELVLDMGGELPVGETGSARVVEVVGVDAEDVERGRALWRQVKAGGFEIVHHPFGAHDKPDDSA